MNKRKPFYIIIAVLCFASIINIFLPYLKLPDDKFGSDGYTLNYKFAVQESSLINKIAKEESQPRYVIYNTAKNIVNGKEREVIIDRIESDQAYLIDIIASHIDNEAELLKRNVDINEPKQNYFDLIKTSISVIKDFKQNVVNAFLVIICLLSIIIIPLINGVHILRTKGEKGYKISRRLAFTTFLLSAIGLISVNAICIGALQVEQFFKSNWGIGFFVAMGLSAAIWVITYMASVSKHFESGVYTWKLVLKQKQLILMTLPFVIYALIFYYGPLVGWVMALQRYKPGIKGEQMWVAWDKFKFLFTQSNFLNVFKNTVGMSLINLVLSFVFAIGFALLLNEVVSTKSKKFVQTISYLPHFLSWIIVTGIVQDVLSTDTGVINEILINTNSIQNPINFFAETKFFWWIVGFSVVWKETGWNSIIYLASISAINPDLYEAAAIDGAGRLKKMIHITLPAIKPTIFILLIINIGMIMNSGFEVQYILGNDIIRKVSETIDIFVLKYSFEQGLDYSIGTAAGIFKSVVSVILIFLANRAAKATDQERLF